MKSILPWSALNKMLKDNRQGDYAREIKGDENAKVWLGNDRNVDALSAATGLDDRTYDEADSVSAEGSSAVHIGNRYGG
jgi:hypothetical protein